MFLGNGDGTFQAPQDKELGTSPVAVAVADLNQDGNLDIVTGNLAQPFVGGLSILLGNGDGTFQDPQAIALDQPPSARTLAVGDLNGDGVPDIIFGSTTGSYRGGITVLLGNGDGTFRSPVNSFTGNSINSLALADFNQDGVLDVAVGSSGGNGPNAVAVLLGHGDGSFQPAFRSYGSGALVGAVGDLNGDGFADVVTPNVLSSGTISVLLNSGDWSGPGGAPSGHTRLALNPDDFRGFDPRVLVATPGSPTRDSGSLASDRDQRTELQTSLALPRGDSAHDSVDRVFARMALAAFPPGLHDWVDALVDDSDGLI
jgi:hypothetical protein